MPYINKKRLHIARGTSASLLDASKFASANDRIQNAGQPAFIEDKFYLTVGNNTNDKRFDQQVPIRVRTVEGYISDAEDFSNNTFILSSLKDNRYRLTGVKEENKPVVYLDVESKFDIRHNNSPKLTLAEDGSNILINDQIYLQSNNIRGRYIRNINNDEIFDISQNSLINNSPKNEDISYSINLKQNTYTNKIFTSDSQMNLKGIVNTNANIYLYNNNKQEVGSIIPNTSTLNINTVNSKELHVENAMDIVPVSNISDIGITLHRTLSTEGNIYSNGTISCDGTITVGGHAVINQYTTMKQGFTSKANSTIEGTLTVNAINLVV